jgi:uncharacterized protein (TIGR02594 family)
MRMRRIALALAWLCLACAPASAFGLAERAHGYLGQTAAQLSLPRTLWCADFLNMLLGGGTGSRQALSYLQYGTPAQHGCTDCIAVIRRGKRRGHVGVVRDYDAAGNPIVVSGNHGRVVGEGVYSRRRVMAYRNP